MTLLTALTAVASTATAQQEAEEGRALPVDRETLEWFHTTSGIETGLAIREIAEMEGRPFSELPVSPNNRPAIGVDVLYRGRNVLVIRDSDGAIQGAGFGGQSAWSRITNEVYRLYPDEFHMVMALTTWNERTAAGYYLPLANEDRGLGYQHLSGVEVFRQTRSENLDGLIFMNNYRTYLGQHAVYGRIVFLQEIGHRWGAFVWYGNGPNNGRDMLGRDESHWSYFLHTKNSALEGNDWRDNQNGAFTTETNAFRLSFSDLDLYLMGFLPKNEVQPWFLIDNPDIGTKRDDYGYILNPASPPAFGGRTTLVGDRWDITIDDVITSEGDRNPSFADSQKYWKVCTVLVVGRNTSFGESDLAVVEGLLDEWEQIFETETRNVADLDFQLEEGPAGGELGFGDSCSTTAQCDTDQATTCLTTDSGRICSHRCVSASDCGDGYCCGSSDSFCYPSADRQCEDGTGENNNGDEPNNNDPNNNGDEPDNNSQPGNPDDPFADPDDPFADPPEGRSSGSGGSATSDCTVAAAPASSTTPWGVLVIALGAIVLAVRRR